VIKIIDYSSTIEGVICFNFVKHIDIRGSFAEIFSQRFFQSLKINYFKIDQVNLSVSKKNVFRGIHYSISTEHQHKIILCLNGSISDFIIDLRVGSPTFGNINRIELDSNNNSMIFIPSGCGHGFLGKGKLNTVLYAQSSQYCPAKELALNCLDKELNLGLPNDQRIILSDRDKHAPNFKEVMSLKLLPSYSKFE
jgi:dTDP-4-dehydrorhamnose 3,5-epimerase